MHIIFPLKISRLRHIIIRDRDNKISFSGILVTFHLIFRLFSSMSYAVGVKYILSFVKYIAELALGKITYEEFIALTNFTFQDFIINKDQTVSFFVVF